MMPNSTKPQPKLRIAAVLALVALLASAALPAAPQVKAEDGPTITPNYKDADLSQIIQAVSEVTGKNFIIDPRVNAKVTMLSATPMSRPRFMKRSCRYCRCMGTWRCRPARSSRSFRTPMPGSCRPTICRTT